MASTKHGDTSFPQPFPPCVLHENFHGKTSFLVPGTYHTWDKSKGLLKVGYEYLLTPIPPIEFWTNQPFMNYNHNLLYSNTKYCYASKTKIFKTFWWGLSMLYGPDIFIIITNALFKCQINIDSDIGPPLGKY